MFCGHILGLDCNSSDFPNFSAFVSSDYANILLMPVSQGDGTLERLISIVRDFQLKVFGVVHPCPVTFYENTSLLVAINLPDGSKFEVNSESLSKKISQGENEGSDLHYRTVGVSCPEQAYALLSISNSWSDAVDDVLGWSADL